MFKLITYIKEITVTITAKEDGMQWKNGINIDHSIEIKQSGDKQLISNLNSMF